MAHKKHQSPQSCNPQVRPHAESVDRPVDWSDESKVAVNATWHSPHSHILQKLASE